MSATPITCAIAGAGPTGLVLAIELARRGHSVRIFDRSPGPRPIEQSRALGILPASLDLLKPSGVTDRILAEALRFDHVQAVTNEMPLFRLNLGAAAGRWPFLTSLQQGRTERILQTRLNELGVQVEWNCQVTKLDCTRDNPVLLVETPGGPESVEAVHIAGCDGVRSVIRNELGIDFDGERLEEPFSLADVKPCEPANSKAPIIHFFDAGTVVVIPLPGGLVRLIGPHSAVHLRTELEGKYEQPHWVSDFEITFRHVKKMQSGRIYLAGDAAHVHSPAGGRGMNTGIGDAAWLAWLIHEGRARTYQDHRLPVAEKIIRETRSITKAVADNGLLKKLVVQHVLPLALKLPTVEKIIVRNLLAYDTPHPPWIE